MTHDDTITTRPRPGTGRALRAITLTRRARTTGASSGASGAARHAQTGSGR